MMKKLSLIALLTVVVLATVAMVAPEKLPQDMQRMMTSAKSKLDSTESTPTLKTSDTMYRKQHNDGSVTFSDTKKDNAKAYKVDETKSVFIDMQGGSQANEAGSSAETGDKSGVAAVLDPVNSINSEAAKNVQKMQEARNQQLAKQGI